MNIRLIEHRTKPKDIYTVFDEMAMEELLRTESYKEAKDKAYNHQCILLCNGKFIHDYSCEY